MNFIPSQGYLLVEDYTENETKSAWEYKSQNELSVVKVIATPTEEEDEEYVGELAVVLPNMIQKFEFQKSTYKIVPDSAVIGFLYEEE